MKKKFRALYGIVMDPERKVRERIFMIITLISIPALICAIIGDLIVGESPVEIATLIITVVMAPIITYFAIKMNKVQLGAVILAADVVFIVVPVSFIFGGALSGGAIIWFCFAYMYIGLLLVGRIRTVLMVLLTIMIIAQYYHAYVNEALETGRSRFTIYVDSGVSVILVGIAVYMMVIIEYRLYLEESRRALEQAEKNEELNRAQSLFFSSMSHEIRTPINTIIGLNEMNLRENVNPEVTENAGSIQSASRILLSLINDILDMSKLESGKMDIIKQPYDVSAMITDLVNMMSVKAKEKGLRFKVSVDPDLPSVLLSDEVRIKQILINLLNNAIKYTAKGEVSFQIHCARNRDGFARVTYTVEDTGTGIKKESIPYLFDAFRRVDEEKNHYIEGTGLGLSIVKQLTELLGGTVSVSSVYSRGSTFNVEIEQEIVDERMIGNMDNTRLNGTDALKRYHQSFEAPEADILVVDDNASNLQVIKKLLRDTLVNVDTADDAQQCLDMTLRKKYNIIFMDHYMPKMSGIEALHAIREQAGGLCRNTPVVALTANAGSEYIALYKREGFEDYLLKPVEPKILESTVLRLLPQDIVRRVFDKAEHEQYESNNVIYQISKKVPVLITTESFADIPEEVLEKSGIETIPLKIWMNDAAFSDEDEVDSNVILRSLDATGREIIPYAPQADDYEEFFSNLLSRSQHIIHIATAKNLGTSYAHACEAAMDFYNVIVFDSGQTSAGICVLAMEAKRLADSGISDTEEILKHLTVMKDKVKNGTLLDSPDYYGRRFLNPDICRFIKMLKLHPEVGVRDSRPSINRMFRGEIKSVRSRFIRNMLKNPDKIDTSFVIITYVGIKRNELEAICDEVLSIVPFEKVYLKKASVIVAINSGPGTIGLYFAER